MHVVVVPILLGRGKRLWMDLRASEGLQNRGRLVTERGDASDIHANSRVSGECE
jgi:hypothetical protein